MSKPRVLVKGYKELPQIVMNLLKSKFNVTAIESYCFTRQEMLNILPGHDALLYPRPFVKIDSEFLDVAGPNLKVISTLSVGHDHLDVDEIKKRGIKIGYCPNASTAAVAEIAVMLILCASRRAHEGRLKLEQADIFPTFQWMVGFDLRGSTVGIVGLGNIGQEVIKRLQGFQVGKFLYTGHSRKAEGEKLGAQFMSLDELLYESDVIVVATPLNSETLEMFDDKMFAKMKKNAVFVNVGRGKVVKTEALVRALKNKIIFAAGLDVTDPEPLPPDHDLLKFPNAVILPHLGSATVKTREEMSMIAAENIINALEGKPMPFAL
ncbi:glyoxylate reductase/hydroxypyruvate reductase-like [Leptopilina boulardi]|uniref:glyoxylate reductase/hydroxypyruvate reductase-like n=1 Tax=Leptopilina boulardi TaxID=63433 RepID=UPI0021F5A454|nr:glyoxylate reductase/hydroxypyruvate reductase-like [Leptopilina boulardi]XP_051158687.1 glyoxylate reductase/hydroxypyruvate reductase-like [Leptopilina boulardi]